MANVNVKAMDTAFQAVAAGKGKSTGAKGTSSDQFRRLLEGAQDNSQAGGKNQEVSKDVKQDKTEESRDAADGVKDDVKGDPKADKAETKEDAGKTEDNSQAQEMLAAYQMSQGLRPEVLQAEPEVVVEIPGITQAEPEIAAVDAAAETVPQTEETAGIDLQPVFQEESRIQSETAAPTDTKVQNVQGQETVKTPEVQEAASTEKVRNVSERGNVERNTSAEESRNVQTENQGAEQAAAMMQTPVRTVSEEVKPQEAVTVQVPQAEELPDKVADQLLSKLAERVQEFEIHIEPENLGKIAVKILYEGGQATVSIFCTEKRALDLLGNNAREIGNIIDRNLGGETKIFVEKQETDYLDQNRDENQQGRQEEQKQQKEQNKKEDAQDADQFLQKLRLGLMG